MFSPLHYIYSIKQAVKGSAFKDERIIQGLHGSPHGESQVQGLLLVVTSMKRGVTDFTQGWGARHATPVIWQFHLHMKRYTGSSWRMSDHQLDMIGHSRAGKMNEARCALKCAKVRIGICDVGKCRDHHKVQYF